MGTTRRMLLGVASSLLAYTTDHTLASPTTTEIPEAELRRATRETLPAFDDGDGEIMTTDREYYAPVDADTLAAIGELVALLPYRTDRFDCDNLAGAYRTLSAFLCGVNAVGTVIDWSGSHAYNIVIDADGDATLYEPQTDTAVAIGDTESYVGERVTVIF